MLELWPELASSPFLLSYLGLFVLAFLSASLLPFGSSWLVILLLTQGESAFTLWWVATLGNSLGGLLNYAVGFYASGYVQRKLSGERFEQAHDWFERYGQWSLLFSWLPVIGDPITLVAGVMRSSLSLFVLLVTLGKAARYAVLIFGFEYLVTAL